MDLEEIKKKFRNKSRADVTELDMVLKALPFLVREIERLESELKNRDDQLAHLSLQVKQRPPLNIKGKKGEAKWESWIDEEKNRLYIKFSGKFDYNSAKSASNNILFIISNIRGDFDLVVDLSKMSSEYSKKVLFHINKVMYTLNKIGIKRIIRVLSSESVQMPGFFDDKSKIGEFKLFTASSIQEADSTIDNLSSKFLKVKA
ncbi:MAG: hypothetical protein HQK79_04915 [Desulfobacterales bacterium]|nr:hypothetical protein [Desulfobacterales bacterium]